MYYLYNFRFRCLLRTMQQLPTNVITIVAAACVLHNHIIDKFPIVSIRAADREDPETHEFIPGAWREVVDLTPLERVRRNTSLNIAKQQREMLKHYYNSNVGSVSWQERATFGKYTSNIQIYLQQYLNKFKLHQFYQ